MCSLVTCHVDLWVQQRIKIWPVSNALNPLRLASVLMNWKARLVFSRQSQVADHQKSWTRGTTCCNNPATFSNTKWIVWIGYNGSTASSNWIPSYIFVATHCGVWDSEPLLCQTAQHRAFRLLQFQQRWAAHLGSLSRSFQPSIEHTIITLVQGSLFNVQYPDLGPGNSFCVSCCSWQWRCGAPQDHAACAIHLFSQKLLRRVFFPKSCSQIQLLSSFTQHLLLLFCITYIIYINFIMPTFAKNGWQKFCISGW